MTCYGKIEVDGSEARLMDEGWETEDAQLLPKLWKIEQPHWMPTANYVQMCAEQLGGTFSDLYIEPPDQAPEGMVI